MRGMRAAALGAALIAGMPAAGRGEVAVSGLLDLVLDNREPDLTNRTFSGTSNFDDLRMRLFFDAQLQGSAQLFTQLVIYDYGDVFLYGAYLRFPELAGTPVNVHVGLIPSTIGNWGPRTYSDTNPLIGIPLVQGHHSALAVREAQVTVDDLLAARDTRPQSGLPVLYDNCWNTGLELWGAAGDLDWSVAALTGSVSYPTRSRQRTIPQATARLAYHAGPGFTIGANGWAGPYLVPDAGLLGDADENEHLNVGGGVDLAWILRYVEVHSEVYRALWEHPTLPDLGVTSGYVEGTYKFAPRWYAAVRLDAFEPDEIRDSGGDAVPWDYPLRRVEYGVGFHPGPRITLKAAVQHNRFDGGESVLDEDHYGVQLGARF